MSGGEGGGRASDRDRRTVDAFIGLATAIAADAEPAVLLRELATRCSEVLDGSEVGVLAMTPDGALRVTTSSSERMHRVEQLELDEHEGPCVDAYRTGAAVVNRSVVSDRRWPHFAPGARSAGYRIVHALPIRHGGEVLGVVNVFDDHLAAVDASDIGRAQALADLTGFAIARTRAVAQSTEAATRLQEALRSRVVIEQAKGALAEQLGSDLDQAFSLLRGYSRNTNTPLADVAHRVTSHDLTAERLLAAGRPKTPKARRPPKPVPGNEDPSGV